VRVAFQGEVGAYSEEAVIGHWGSRATPLPRPHLQDVFDVVEAGEADMGLVPVENSVEGTIARTLDLLYERPLKIQGETVLRVRHCLIANPGVKLGDVKRVYSHPQALGQSRAFLEGHRYEAVAEYDTAGSVKLVKEKGMMDAAAVAGRRAAQVYGMEVLAEGIETSSENYTRFLAVGAGEAGPTGRDKTSLAFTLNNNATLIGALNTLALEGVELFRIDIRPLLGEPWRYVYFIDLEGHIKEPAVGRALERLGEQAKLLKHLGSYPRAA
jgi:chorismate mutase/prephenate dehydratase